MGLLPPEATDTPILIDRLKFQTPFVAARGYEEGTNSS